MAALTYVRDDGTRYVYHFLADGDRPVLEIIVDAPAGAEQLPISINAIGAPESAAQLTKGFTVLAHATTTNVDGELSGMIRMPDLEGIASYVIPQIHTLMARVYVPKTS